MNKAIIIVLEQIRHKAQTTPEALGVKKEDVVNCVKHIFATCRTYGDILLFLGLNEVEVSRALKSILADDKPKITKAIVRLWREKGRETITLEEYVGTSILMWEKIRESERELKLVKKEIKRIKEIPKIVIRKGTVPRTLQKFD